MKRVIILLLFAILLSSSVFGIQAVWEQWGTNEYCGSTNVGDGLSYSFNLSYRSNITKVQSKFGKDAGATSDLYMVIGFCDVNKRWDGSNIDMITNVSVAKASVTNDPGYGDLNHTITSGVILNASTCYTLYHVSYGGNYYRYGKDSDLYWNVYSKGFPGSWADRGSEPDVILWGENYTGAGAGANVFTPVFVNATPGDGVHNTTNITIEFNCTTNSTFLWFDQSTNPKSPVINNGTTSTWVSNMSADGTYYYKAGCLNGEERANSSTRSFVLDTTQPSIVFLNSHSIQANNTIVLSNYITNLTINFSVRDTNLYDVMVNITNSTPFSFYQNYTVISGFTNYNFTQIVNISNLKLGNYTIRIETSDSHTLKEIEPYGVIKALNSIIYNTPDGNLITIEMLDNALLSRFDTTKLVDRYTFDVDLKEVPKGDITFRVTCRKELKQVQKSQYPAHMVCGKNWIDFQEMKVSNYKVIQVNDYIADVVLSGVDTDRLRFNSVGGLNVNGLTYDFSIGSVIYVKGYNAYTSAQIPINVTIGTQTGMGNASEYAILENITIGNRTITLSSAGYENLTTYLQVNQSLHNVTYQLTELGIVINLYDETTLNRVNGSFNIYLESTGYSHLHTGVTNNPFVLSGLPIGTYKVRVYNDDYLARQYLDKPITSSVGYVLNVYLLNNSFSNSVVFSIKDTNSNALESVFCNISAYLNGTWVGVSQFYSDYAGQFLMGMNPNIEYRLTLDKSSYNHLALSLTPVSTAYTIYMVTSVTTIPEVYKHFKATSLDYNFTYVNSTKTFSFYWNDESNGNYSDYYCLSIEINSGNKTVYCNDSHYGYFNYTVTLSNRTYFGTAYTTKNGVSYVIKTIYVNLLETWVNLGTDLLMIDMIIFLIMCFMGLAYPVASLVMGLIALVSLSYMEMLPIGKPVIFGLIFTIIVIFVKTRRE